MADTKLLGELVREHLADAGLVRIPRIAAPPAGADELEVPPMWIDQAAPPPGAPGPSGETVETGRDLVVSASHNPGIESRRHEWFMANVGLVFRFRVRGIEWLRAFYQWEADLHAQLHDRRGWECAGLTIQESLRFRGPYPIERTPVAYDLGAEYLFWFHERDLFPGVTRPIE
jgi:hypothetical protein